MTKERKQKERKLLEQVREDGSKNSGFARALGSTDLHTRERGLQALTTWLKCHKDVTEHDLQRLWKALFFCFWHSDKVPVQTALAERLSEIINQVPPAVAHLYFKVFVQTMRREWFSIDRHRMDKFLMLVRKFYAEHLRYLQSTEWDSDILAEFSKFWQKRVLLPGDTLAAAGLSYHIIDLVLPELSKIVDEKSSSPPSAKTLKLLLSPFCMASTSTRDKVMVGRLKQSLWDGIAQHLLHPGDSHALKHLDYKSLADDLFELGAREDTRALNREALYAASRAIDAAGQNRGKPKKKKSSTEYEVQKDNKKLHQPSESVSLGKKRRKLDEDLELHGVNVKRAMLSKAIPKKKVSIDDDDVAAPDSVAPDRETKPTEETIMADESSKKTNKKKKRKDHVHGALDNNDDDVETPVGSPLLKSSHDKQQQEQQHDREQRRKSVRFSLKRNLVMTIGQPPLPEDVRTPPTARPKGSALKRSSRLSTAGGQSEHTIKPSVVKKLDVSSNGLTVPSSSHHHGMCNSTHNGGGSHMKKKRSPVETRSRGQMKKSPNSR